MSFDSADDQPQTLKTIGLEEAAAVLRIAPSTLRKRAAAGKVQGYKPGRQWVFLPHEIAAYLRASAPPVHRTIDVKTLRTGCIVASRSTSGKATIPLAEQIQGELRKLKAGRAARRGRS